MKKITIHLPDWLYERIEKLKIGNFSASIRTLLIFSVKDFEDFIKELGLESEEEEPEERMIQVLKNAIDRLIAGGMVQNKSFPGIPADFELVTNRLEADKPVFDSSLKLLQNEEHLALAILSDFDI